MQPSRRAFLLGRRPVRDPWTVFLEDLALRCRGAVGPGAAGGGPPSALLTPCDETDVARARALCAERGVTLALAGAPGPHAVDGKPVLRVDPRLLDALEALPDGQGWRAQPGVRAGALARAGLAQFADAPGDLMLAQWLAAPAPWPEGRTAASGLAEVEALLADGARETLGAFGENDVRPLRTATVQRLAPALFQLAASGPHDGRYRLDALRPQAPAGVNLAHLLLGHGGTLAWVAGAVLRPPAAAAAPGAERPAAVSARDGRIKSLFDPGGLFPGFVCNRDIL
jgi:hypothetical protein